MIRVLMERDRPASFDVTDDAQAAWHARIAVHAVVDRRLCEEGRNLGRREGSSRSARARSFVGRGESMSLRQQVTEQHDAAIPKRGDPLPSRPGARRL